MNRIILIGNGFDLAHGLPTGYTDFINWYWKEFVDKSSKVQVHYDDEFVGLEQNANGVNYVPLPMLLDRVNSYNGLKQRIKEINRWHNSSLKLSFKNKFWGHISDIDHLQHWVDIENEYYTLLRDFLKEGKDRKHKADWPTVKDLNREFGEVKGLLEKYLTEKCSTKVTSMKQIVEVLNSKIDPLHLSVKRNKHSVYQSASPDSLFILNFNYTDTIKSYFIPPSIKIINIHGELNSKNNPIIFGYGDELDDDYKAIERTNDNDFLENIKSIHYHNTKNYRQLLDFMQRLPYQVFILGHSCGNSDRTLLNTIFEHSNCVSIKPYFYQWRDDETGELKDNYTEIVQNISRNFNDKQAMRDVVVNREYCSPLVPCPVAEDKIAT